MSTIAAIARRNLADRMAQLSRLQPRRVDAKQKIEALRGAKEGPAHARASLELMANLKHVPNFFPTPKHIVERMIDEAALEPGMVILEPSAGKGDIAAALLRVGVPVNLIQCIEINHTLGRHLIERGFYCRIEDFLEYEVGQKFDRVLMNPPFERGVDVDHIRHAYTFLRPSGRLVAICCSTTGSKLESWAADCGGFVEPLPDGTFARSERSTNVRTSLLVAHS